MWIWLLIAAPFALYPLHRLCLRLEEQGYLYYRHKQPMPGGTSALLLMQEFYEPQVREVIAAEDHAVEKADDDRYAPAPPDPARWHPLKPQSDGPVNPDTK